MTECGRCGAENADAELVCLRCGTELDDGGARALIGQVVLGVYEIVDVLGRGGMSVVYRAQHKMTEQRVALKILPPELAIHASLKTRFLEEARALGRLEHPNIVRLYNFGEEAGRFVLAMEFVEGKTFERMIFEQGRVGWEVVARVGVEVLRALEYAHDKGVVHRDIKPSNVLVRADGSATVMDFGIAKMTESTRLTATGQTMGTVRYMSPEQVRGQVVDHRTDLYSLGVALFEGLVGDTPFQGETHFDIMSKHLSEPPPSIRAAVADVPEALERVVHRALGKGREERWQSAGEMRAALEKCVEGLPADAVTPAPVLVRPPAPAAPAAPAARDVDTRAVAPAGPSVQTGLSDRLEPRYDDAAVTPATPRRTGLWLALGAVVAAAALVAIVIMGQRGDAQSAQAKGAPANGGGAARADAAEAMPAWPEPTDLPGVRFVVDEKFEAPRNLRVRSSRQVDATKLAEQAVVARQRFVAFVAARALGVEVEQHPFNLDVLSPAMMCDPAVYAPDRPPEQCSRPAYAYNPTTRTVSVPDDKDLERLNLPEGVAVHLCRTTAALHRQGCMKVVLGDYFDEIEK